jgi:hypothetical protein
VPFGTEPALRIHASCGIFARYNGGVRRRALLLWLVAALGAAAAVLILADGDDSQPPPPVEGPIAKPPPAPAGGDHDGKPEPRTQRQAVRQAVHEAPAARLNPQQRRAAAVVRDYVGALSAADGRRVCALFADGALDGVDFPRERGGCAASVSASVGYADPRGLPGSRAARVARVPSVPGTESDARVTATVVTRFAEGRDPSIEDDVVYLRAIGGRWLIVQPSVELYRAIGVGDVPPRALAPPG